MNCSINRLLLLSLVLALSACERRSAVDHLFINGAVYTVNPEQPWAQALAVRDGLIIDVGDQAEMLEVYDGAIVDLEGKMLLPGFHDSHSHLIYGGLELRQCLLYDSATVEEIIAKIQSCDADLGPDEWLVGAGWNLSLFELANPSKLILDEINPNRMMFLKGADGHSAWVSSKALVRAGIVAETPDPSDGLIERNSIGEPTGTLRESAMTLVEQLLPGALPEDLIEAAENAIALSHSLGITSAIDAAATEAYARAFDALASEGRMNLRLVLAMPVISPFFDQAPRESVVVSDRGRDQSVRRHAAKVFVDGVLEGETAALLEPYLGASPHSGMLVTPPEALNRLVTEMDKSQIQIMFHAIGDRGVRVALNAVEAAQNANGYQDLRHHISHLQMIDPEDQPRFKELAVSANFQALWALPDDYIMEINLPAVGEQRVAQMYPIGSLEAAGARIVGGSDWPISSMNPLAAIETAITRADAEGKIPGSLNLTEAVSLETMLRAYTLEGAYLMHQESTTGSLEVGKRADLVVLSDNLFEVEADRISDVWVERTYFSGQQVYPQ